MKRVEISSTRRFSLNSTTVPDRHGALIGEHHSQQRDGDQTRFFLQMIRDGEQQKSPPPG